MGSARVGGRAVALTVVLLCLASPSALARSAPSTAPSPSPSTAPSVAPSPTTPRDGGVEAEPSAEEIAAQARARELRTRAQADDQAVRTAQQRLDDATAAASVALEAYRLAARAAATAQARSLAAQSDLDTANADLSLQRAELGRWARGAYAEGGSLAGSPTLTTLLTGAGTDDLARAAFLIGAVGDTRARMVAQLSAALARQQQVAEAADRAARDAAAAATQASTAKADRDAAVSEQRALVAAAEVQLRASTQAADAADAQAQELTAARLRASGVGGYGGGPIGPGGNAVTGAVGDCPGGDTASYPNGQIPLSALCPVWGAPGHYLRADAAFAFGKLSADYARAFGTPICVTDSYRTYAAQVDVYARRPDLAAVPGTSNHGWGTATDLCGGIESFGTPTHAWMLLHAPGYGWFHPGWAEPGGSRPEAWHWEYGG